MKNWGFVKICKSEVEERRIGGVVTVEAKVCVLVLVGDDEYISILILG